MLTRRELLAAAVASAGGVLLGRSALDGAVLAQPGCDPTPTPTPLPSGFNALQKKTRADVQRAISWRNQHGLKLTITEFGWPNTDTRWNAIGDGVYQLLDQNSVPATYWAGGPWWGSYPLAAIVGSNVRSQMSVLDAHPGAASILNGINLAGGEFGSNMPGVYGTDYIYPGATDFNAVASILPAGTVRVPFKWERMVRSWPYGQLDNGEVARINTVLAQAETAGLKVILECHNYGRRIINGVTQTMATSGPLNHSHLRDLWLKIASRWRGNGTLLGYEIMNEPHDLVGGAATWQWIANQVVEAIRNPGLGNDPIKPVFVATYDWSSSVRVAQNHPNGGFITNGGDIWYVTHYYADPDQSGNYGSGGSWQDCYNHALSLGFTDD